MGLKTLLKSAAPFLIWYPKVPWYIVSFTDTNIKQAGRRFFFFWFGKECQSAFNKQHSTLYMYTVAVTSQLKETSVFIVYTLHSSAHRVFCSFSCKCHEWNYSDLISNIRRQSAYEIENGRPSALNLKTHSKHMCQLMSSVYNAIKSSACQKVRIFAGTCRTAGRLKGVRKICKWYW